MLGGKIKNVINEIAENNDMFMEARRGVVKFGSNGEELRALAKETGLTEDQLIYYPTVTRERFSNKGRLTELMLSGKLFADLKLPQPDKKDRFMVCGSPSMLQDICTILDKWGFEQAEKKDTTGDYVIERAFVDS